MEKYIWELGSLIFAILGSIHLLYTFFSNKFSSRNKQVLKEMKSSNPILTNETTIWKAWIGFNASHSSGAIFIGLINIYLAERFFESLITEPFFICINLLTVSFYLWLAKKYWFKIPFIGILITLICYISAIIIHLTIYNS
ncbi:MAG: hypothetical protein P8H13_10075 [Polaribacter sp.]|nr:hypothetical protein [Polaribacter sp.]MDG1812270.1 hypothetical protein [Polaribacter sp.]MDG1992951.1 hypothetical protein [Polaribacter sp.]